MRACDGGRTLLALMTAAAAVSGGCVGMMGDGVPVWAMHVRPAPVDYTSTAEQVAERVTRELASPELAPGHVPAEQLALIAIRDIDQRQLADAGLWLAIADYRYYQQATQARKKGLADAADLPANVNHNQFLKLVVAEMRLYGELGFDDEIETINERLWGRSETEVAVQEQLMDLGKTAAVDRVSLRDAIAELRPAAATAMTTTRYPGLAEAFRRRLMDDFARDHKAWSAGYYLSQTPVAALRKDAVVTASRPFVPRMCSAIAASFPLQRPAVVAALAHRRPDVRANAAATLGMAPTQETRALVEARLPIETDAQVKLALAFSLFHHGVPEHLATLTGALATCQPATCVLPASLVDWLPLQTKAELEQAPLARIVADTRMDVMARLFAAAALRDIGKIKPLEPASVEALVVAARTKGADERLRDVATGAVENADSLSRADVVARLTSRSSEASARNDVLFPGPLLARLAKVSTAADLPLLRQTVERFGDHDSPEAHYAVDAALNIPGDPPLNYLGNWFIRYPRLQTHIGLALATRDSYPRAWLDRLMTHGNARTRIVVKLARHDADAGPTLLAYLQRGDIDERFQASSVAWLAGQVGVEDTLRALLTYRDARFYPHDALVRYSAMMSLVRLALIKSRPRDPAATDADTDIAAPAPATAPRP